ncbi:hypothetical protein EDC01DRAFT_627558 [Geopyxis carbonaria]|nr:hypothetical protein EDC01DRAFT_627558 [Geopyxis carbonaria]
MNLPHCKSKQEARNLLSSFINNHEQPNASSWARHKLNDHILCGLNKYASNMDRDFWDKADKSSNWVESAHSQSNRWTGRQMALLSALMTAKYLDQTILDRCKAMSIGGIPRSWPDSTTADMQHNSMQRSLKRRRDREWTPDEETEDTLIDLNDLNTRPIQPSPSRRPHGSLQSNSSGLPPKKKKRSQKHLVASGSNTAVSCTPEAQMQELEIEKQKLEIRRLQRLDALEEMKLEKEKIELEKAKIETDKIRRQNELAELEHSKRVDLGKRVDLVLR